MFKSLKFNKEIFFDASTGKRNEAMLFSFIDTSSPEYRLAEKGYQENSNDQREVPFIKKENSILLVKRFQSETAHDPKTQFLRELRIEVADRLGLDTTEEMERIAAYTAIGRPRGTALDFYHGVDAFITYKKPGIAEIIITLDRSARDKNLSEIKADFLIKDEDVPDPVEADKFMEAVESFANKVAALINKRIDELEPHKPQSTYKNIRMQPRP